MYKCVHTLFTAHCGAPTGILDYQMELDDWRILIGVAMDNDDITLPADTLAILNEFLAERSQREHDEEQRLADKSGKDAHFEEDWVNNKSRYMELLNLLILLQQLSQFWYSEGTKRAIGNAVANIHEQGNSEFRIALLSCPSLYATVKDVHANGNIKLQIITSD